MAELQSIEVVSGEECEDAVQSGDLIEQEGEENELGRRAEGDKAQDSLQHCQ